MECTSFWFCLVFRFSHYHKWCGGGCCGLFMQISWQVLLISLLNSLWQRYDNEVSMFFFFWKIKLLWNFDEKAFLIFFFYIFCSVYWFWIAKILIFFFLHFDFRCLENVSDINYLILITMAKCATETERHFVCFFLSFLFLRILFKSYSYCYS